MKRIVSTLIAAILLFSTTQAQTEKGNYMLGGTTTIIGGSGAIPNQLSLGFGHYKRNFIDVFYYNVNFSTNGGYFIANGLMLGLNVSALHNNNRRTINFDPPEDDVSETFKYTDFSIAPFVRYYLNQGKKIQYFGEARVGMAINKVDDFPTNDAVLFGAKAGAALFINRKVSLDLFYDFTSIISEIKTNDSKNFDAFHGIGIGFDIFL